MKNVWEYNLSQHASVEINQRIQGWENKAIGESGANPFTSQSPDSSFSIKGKITPLHTALKNIKETVCVH